MELSGHHTIHVLRASQKREPGAKIGAAFQSYQEKIETGESAMSEIPELKTTDSTPKTVTRRRFILGVIASGGAVAAANYKFISSAVHGQMSSAGERLITIN